MGVKMGVKTFSSKPMDKHEEAEVAFEDQKQLDC